MTWRGRGIRRRRRDSDSRMRRCYDVKKQEASEGCEELLTPARAAVSMPDVETQYQQSKAYVELNQHLQEELSELASQSEELKKAEELLDLSISEIKEKNFQNWGYVLTDGSPESSQLGGTLFKV
ncbi:hypothetical protein scyTo_0007849 [Scyliorhinus torazame]|uniref:Shootin-1 n=1 Tax=Scyliorhinus torazame TaxID=75743 RepID=A0A401NZK3_SCYTO|nr:hypothetical protein [Scyliorhinus torazame]